MTKPLSPAAQAVLDASNLHPCKDSCLILAAALRAAADQVVPQTPPLIYAGEYESGVWEANNDVRVELLAIAAELEGQ